MKKLKLKVEIAALESFILEEFDFLKKSVQEIKDPYESSESNFDKH